MIAAAGILILAPGLDGKDTALFLLRGPGGDHAFEWGFPGGQIEAGESAAEGAARECEEECGLVVEPDLLDRVHTRGVTPAMPAPDILVPGEGAEPVVPLPVQTEDVDFVSFVHRVKAQFEPTLCDESVGYCWAPVDHPPAPLHPGCGIALERLAMDELDLAEAMAAGRLVSPQLYENMALFNLRITGTGAAYRKKINEYVWRKPEQYLNERFVRRCNGLPVVWEHPKKAVLDSKEFSDRVIGTIMLPYIKGDEVWGIARIYDAEAIDGMISEQISTSPTVVFRDRDASVRTQMEDGSTILIEGEPDLLDHLAVCGAGVWDKGGAPVGVDRSAIAEPGEIADQQAAEAIEEPTRQAAFADDVDPLALLGARARTLRIRTQLNLASRAR